MHYKCLVELPGPKQEGKIYKVLEELIKKQVDEVVLRPLDGESYAGGLFQGNIP